MSGLTNLFVAAALFVTFASEAFGGVNSWTGIGPSAAPNPRAVAVDPADISTIYVTARDPFRLLKTVDGGASWTGILTSDREFIAIVVDPVTPSTVYAAAEGLVNFGGALYRSTDGGSTWALRNLGLVNGVLSVTIDPVTPSTLYARTRDGPGIYKSADSGGSWNAVLDTVVASLAIDSVVPTNLYAGTNNGNGILKSTNGGGNWTPIRVVPPDVTAALGYDATITALLVDPVTPTTVYAGVFLPGGFFRSTDGGSTWTAMASRFIDVPNSGRIPILGLVAIPGAPPAFFAWTYCGLFKSLDGGLSWTDANAGLEPNNGLPNCYVPVTDLANVPSAPNILFATHFYLGTFRYAHDAALLPPACFLTATPVEVAAGGSASLASYCTPAATSYVWSQNTGFSSSDSGGTVFPTRTTSYTVQGVNANGASNVASVTVLAASPRLTNMSTRGQVLTGNDVMIGGFVIGGTTPKTVVVRARGPSLAPFGIANALGNPTLRLMTGNTVIAVNDDWGTASNASTIQASGFAPSDPLESAFLGTLNPGAYTAIVSGAGGTTGVGIVEVFEVDHPEIPLANISTRGQVLTGNDVMIGGFIVDGGGPQTVVVRARGPSLIPYGITNALANPVLQLFSGQTLMASNDDWIAAPNAAQIQSSGFVPASSLESAILITLQPGAYTAIVTGAGGGTGVGIVEVFAQ